MNFVRDVVDAAPADATALVELTRAGERRRWTFGQVSEATARFAGHLQEGQGVGKGDVVLIWLGNRAEWVLSMLACFRLGAVAAACPEQLRAGDLRQRIEVVSPAVIVADERNRDELSLAEPESPVVWLPDDALWRRSQPAPAADLSPEDPCLVTFTSGTSGTPKAVVHLQRYVDGQRLQARHWMAAGQGDTVWCTASTGWSKSARNAFVAPWLRGATAVLFDGRFDPHERLSVVQQEKVSTLCMSPTEYLIIVKRAEIPALPSLRSCVAAGEPLDPGVVAAWHDAAGVWVRDGYGQTETGQLTGFTYGETVKAGSMGRPLPGIRLWLDDGELVADPSTVPTFFAGYLGEAPTPLAIPWRTGDRVEVDEDGCLWFTGRTDDIIVSAGYRIGPFEVESALASHSAVEEAAAVAAPDDERGAIVRAVVVLRSGYEPSDELRTALQAHVKAQTAPYKYPRRIDFVGHLPKTATGKVQRATLRSEP